MISTSRPLGNLIPVLRPRAAGVHESPIEKLRRVWGTPEGDVVDRDAGVLKIDRISQNGAGFLRGILEISVVIAGAHNDMLERLFSKPTVEGQNILWAIARVHKIASVNQNISVGKTLDPVVQAWVSAITQDTHRLDLNT